MSPGRCAGRSLRVPGPCLQRTECGRPKFGCGAEWGRLWGRWTGIQGPGAGSGVCSLGPRPRFPRPLDFVFRPLPVLRDLVWFILGRARGSTTGRVGEKLFNSLGSNSSLVAPLPLFRLGIKDFHFPVPESLPSCLLLSHNPFGSLAALRVPMAASS